MKNHPYTRAFGACFLLGLLLPLHAEEDPAKGIPDLTKGGKLERINERWAAPIGIYCGFWRPRQRSQEAGHVKQLLVQQVEKDSPADGVLQVGDVILGADGTGAKEVPLFKGAPWPMIPIANAITEAEAHNPAVLNLRIWRPAPNVAKGDPKALKAPTLDDLDLGGLEGGGGAGGLDDWKKSPDKESQPNAEPTVLDKEMTVTIKLDYLGRYSDTAPYNCEKSRNILKKGIDALLKEEKGDKAGFSILCLLAAAHPDDPRHDAMMAKAKQWAHALEDGGNPWYVGPKLMALSEYYMKSKDETILPKLKALAEYHALGVSWFGTCGHRYSEPQPDGSPNGRIAGYGPITASGVLGYLGLSLAREAGINTAAVEKSHKAQEAFFGHYGGKSGLNYGEMPYGIGGSGGDYNGKMSTSALALSLEEDQQDKVKFFTKSAALSGYSVRQYAHGGTFFGQVFHPLGAALAGEKAANLQFREVGWHMDLKRRWDYRYLYDSSGNGYEEFDHAAVALLFYALPLKQIIITGRDRNPALELTDKEFEEILKVKNYDATKHTLDELFADLPTVQGLMRGHVGEELGRRVKEKPEAAESSEIIDRLLKMAVDPNAGVYGQTGACFSLMMIKDRSQEPVASMKNAEIAATIIPLLRNKDAYIRFAGVRVLQKLDPSAVRHHADAIMDAIAATDRPLFPLDMEDPLQWAHGEMGDLLVRKALADGLEGINRDKLIPAIRSLLQTPNGGARGACSAILSKLNKEDTLLVSDLLVDNIKISPPGNAMGGAASTLNSQKALAAHNFEEAILLSVDYGPELAIKSKVPQKFGKAALGMSSARDVMKTAGERMLINAVDARELVDSILKGEGPKELDVLKRIESVTAANPALNLPAATTELVADATNFSDPVGDQTTYTWRKVYGAGKVSFNPNASKDSKTTTVTFADKKPGKYCFELEMTDALGLTTVRETVTVTLNGSNGKLSANKAPNATSQALEAKPGFPVAVNFSGSDPDGDDLGYTVTQLPEHGVLTGADGRRIEAMAAIDGPITYTADFGHEGTDQLSFIAIDGQGLSSKGTIEFKVSGANVPVVVYEGFNYPMDGVHGQEGNGSFGFMGPWKNSRGTKDNYKVHRASLKDPGKTASITFPNLPSRDGRLTGGGHTTVSRYLDTKLLAKHGMLKPGGELWFSAFVDGDARLCFTGPNTEFGFNVKGTEVMPWLNGNGKDLGENYQSWSRMGELRIKQNEPAMVVGHCLWGRTDDEPDTLTLYRVYNAPVFGPMLIDQPASDMKQLIDQEKINAIVIGIAENRAIDEIRIGASAASVMQGTVPLN